MVGNTHLKRQDNNSSPIKQSRTTRVKSSPKPILCNHKRRDFYNFSGEYQPRDITCGHGRHKSEEWNDKVALQFKNILMRLNESKTTDPNSFDRGQLSKNLADSRRWF